MPLKEDAIEIVLQKSRLNLIAFIRTILKDYQTSEDAYQEVSLIAIRNGDKFNDEEHLLKWLWKTSRFTALSMARAQKRLPILMDEGIIDLIQDYCQEQDNSKTERLQFLEVCLAKLSEYGRKVIHLRYEENLKGKKLAQALGLKLGSAYVAVSRVHLALSNCVKEKMQEIGL